MSKQCSIFYSRLSLRERRLSDSDSSNDSKPQHDCNQADPDQHS